MVRRIPPRDKDSDFYKRIASVFVLSDCKRMDKIGEIAWDTTLDNDLADAIEEGDIPAKNGLYFLHVAEKGISSECAYCVRVELGKLKAEIVTE
jgi:hypothetical protein